MRRTFGAIIFSRTHVVAGWAAWESPAPAGEIEEIDGERLARQLPAFLEQDTAGFHWEKWPVTTKSREEVWGKACDFLTPRKNTNLPDQRFESITVSGFGPFEKVVGSNDFGGTTEEAHAPFQKFKIRAYLDGNTTSFVRHIGDAACVSIITDVAAMAVAGYWCDWLKSGDLQFNKPNVVAAFIVGKGIGGAVAQRQGEIVGQNHHAEIGQLPVRVHPRDRLEVSKKGERDCLSFRASSRAMEQRLAPHQTLARLGKNILDPAWDIEADYITQMCEMAIFTSAPTRILIGGSLIEHAPQLVERVRYSLAGLSTGWLSYPQLGEFATFVRRVDRHRTMLQGALLHGLKQSLSILSPQSEAVTMPNSGAALFADRLSEALFEHDPPNEEPSELDKQIAARLRAAGVSAAASLRLSSEIGQLASKEFEIDDDQLFEQQFETFASRPKGESVHHFIMRVYGKYLATGVFTKHRLAKLDPGLGAALNKRVNKNSKSPLFPKG